MTVRKFVSLLKILFLFFMLCPFTLWPQNRAQLIQSVDVQIPVIPAAVTIAKKKYLSYEIHITNLRGYDVELKSVEVYDAANRNRLAAYQGHELSRRLGRPGLSDLKEKRIVSPGMRAVLYLWMPLEPEILPAELKHRIQYTWIRTDRGDAGMIDGLPASVNTNAAIVLDPPLKGGPWVALYDPQMEHGHRTSIYTIEGRARIPARFAIDWIRLESDASHAKGDDTEIANWYGYGAEVLAVADAIVVEAKDDIPEAPTIGESQKPVELQNASGNYVTLDLGNGQFAFYEHLKHGSIKVKKGERVKSGQVIGLLGNSGSSSSGPHLHFHVSNANSTLAAEGLPFAFKTFEVIGKYETIVGFSTGKLWEKAPAEHAGKRTAELPGPNTVVVFP